MVTSFFGTALVLSTYVVLLQALKHIHQKLHCESNGIHIQWEVLLVLSFPNVL